MRTLLGTGGVLIILACGAGAQETTLVDVRRELREVRKELDKLVHFCTWCEATGKLEGHPCRHCDGLGVMLEAEHKAIEHRLSLEETAVRRGRPRSDYAAFDIAHKQAEFRKQYDSQAFDVLERYVAYVKVWQEYRPLIEKDAELKQRCDRTLAGLDRLIDRYGRKLRIRSMKLFYEDDPSSKVGTFVLYGRRGTVKLDGREATLYALRTLKDYRVALKPPVRQVRRKGFVLAEIESKGSRRTDDGKEMQLIVLQAY